MSSVQEIADQIWATYDSDNDGNISLEESLAFFTDLISKRADLGLTAEHHAEWFGKIDANSDGSISKEEMVAYLTSINYTA
jgi:hypothetical protein